MAATGLAAFASLGLPGLAGFVAELQIFAGTFAVYPWLAAIGIVGIVITAALFLTMVQQIFFGTLPDARRNFADLRAVEAGVLAALLLLVVAIGVYPAWLLKLIERGSAALLGAG
jgi:NADH-quinone oxidoreductase subunit M